MNRRIERALGVSIKSFLGDELMGTLVGTQPAPSIRVKAHFEQKKKKEPPTNHFLNVI